MSRTTPGCSAATEPAGAPTEPTPTRPEAAEPAATSGQPADTSAVQDAPPEAATARPEADPAWPAPTATGDLDATVEVPGSKSLTNRLLVLAALGSAPATLSGALRSRDADLMIAALRALGVGVEEGETRSTLTVRPAKLRGPARIDCGLAGTVMRFLPPAAALATGEVWFDGDPEARVRPMAPLLGALADLGVRVTAPRGGPAVSLPFVLAGTGRVPGGDVRIDASASSQFVSGLLLAGARYERGLTVTHVGGTVPSLPHIEMTVAVLRAAGVQVDDSAPGAWRVAPGPILLPDTRVEPDLSNAAPFLAAALVAGGTVRVPGWPATSTQPGAQLPELLTAMGAAAHLAGGTLTVTGTGTVHGIDADLHAVGELAPTIAALAALADSPSVLRGIAHLRGHETNRLAALAAELTRLGADVRETTDGLDIRPRPLHAARLRTYHDHRMATSAALLGLAVPGVEVEDVATTAKTLPDFTGLWTDMLGSRDR